MKILMERNTKNFFCTSSRSQIKSIQLEIVNKLNRYVNLAYLDTGLTWINAHDNLNPS